MSEPTGNETLERVSAIVHECWADWAAGLLREESLSEPRQTCWRSFLVPYADLPEQVKDWDRYWARKVLAAVDNAAGEIAQVKNEVRALRAELNRLKEAWGRPSKQRNPFGLPDVPDPDGMDVQSFAAGVELAGDAVDANAEQWVKESATAGDGDLDGEWHGRWNFTGRAWVPVFKARVQSAAERIYIFYIDHQGRFLIDLQRDQNRLVGRLRGIDNPCDTDPCVFAIVNRERLDGTWGGKGRLDFRRRLA